MNIKTRSEADITIVDLEGKLTIGVGDVQLREMVGRLLDEGVTKIILNLGGVRAMDSSGLGELLGAKASAATHDATIKLVHVEDKVQQVFDMTRLIGVFETFNDESEAVASFRDS